MGKRNARTDGICTVIPTARPGRGKPSTQGCLNRKVRRLALRSLLSEKVIENNLVVVDALKFDAIKTKEFVKVMDAFKFEGKTLFVADIAEDFDNAFMSLRNIPNAALLTVEELNAFDIANAAKLVMTEAAANKAGEVFA